MTINFDDFMYEVSQIMKEDLRPDFEGKIKLTINEKFPIQIEYNTVEQMILMSAPIHTLEEGRLKEAILSDALKANNFTQESPGVLSFIPDTNELFIFSYSSLVHNTPQKFCELFYELIAKTERWVDALNSGATSPEEITNIKTTSSSLLQVKEKGI